jgi:hypothetical protein
MQITVTFVASLLFGLGLVVSGLANPAKVQNFLNIAGAWDPSLAFTMATAILLTGLGYVFVFKRGRPVLADTFQLPTAIKIDLKLVSGAALFGVGWGLVGYCPGPAIVALPLGNVSTAIFVAAMLAGMLAARILPSAQQQKLNSLNQKVRS